MPSFFYYLFVLCILFWLQKSFGKLHIHRTNHRHNLGKLSKDDNSMETFVSKPVRLLSNFYHIRSSNHFRKRRSASSEKSLEREHAFSNPIYKIQAFENELVVFLEPDRTFFAPAFMTVYSWKNSSVSDIPTSLPSSRSIDHCFFKGKSFRRRKFAGVSQYLRCANWFYQNKRLPLFCVSTS